jgi:hypothetical protein
LIAHVVEALAKDGRRQIQVDTYEDHDDFLAAAAEPVRAALLELHAEPHGEASAEMGRLMNGIVGGGRA